MFQFTQSVMFVPEDGSSPTPITPAAIANADIAAVLFNIATILEMQQGNPYRITAYKNAARVLMVLQIPVAEIIARGQPLEWPGLGKRLQRKITELVTTGRMTFYDDLCEASLPEDVRSLMTVPRVGPKTALRLANSLDIHSVAALYEAAHAHKLSKHHGFGSRSERRLEENALAVLTPGHAA
ncbi:MAG TPA: helix-hairpin-helix domain-containing protein [Ktedonobacterales bacterium]